MTNDKRPVLVFGATGRQGRSVAKALLKAGWPVHCFSLGADSCVIADEDAG
ncbi:NmrA family NAD(P)-binding protein [Phyllobacterium phragmitis]|uniref:NmrA family NAD(P)-binding protein n=1 Tax=Phyllobacterium phragmitis TaxID=2670329 RepID=UPI0038B31217